MAILDGRQVATANTALAVDVAVVGAGPAGIVTALSLADEGHRVLVLESGHGSFDADVQHLGDVIGEDPYHVSMQLATRREIGGASVIWGGRCVPFDPIDFETRDIAGQAAWPVSYEEIAPFFERACDWCVCGDAVFDAHQISKLADRAIVPGLVDGDLRASALERWSLPTNFGRRYRKRIRQSPDLTLVTGLTCTEIVCRDSGREVDHLVARTIDGRAVEVRASKYVVACGGVESTRLLFASRRHHLEGLGNHSGHLGRWYMAHVEARIAEVRFSTPASETIYGYERDAEGVYVRRRFTISAEMQRRLDLPNVALWMVNPKLSDATHGSGVLSFVYLMLISPLGHLFVAEGIRRAHTKTTEPVSKWAHVRNVLRSLPSTVFFALRFGYERFLRPGRKVPGFFVRTASNAYPLQYHGEHLPSYESCIRQSDEVDALGMPRVETHLRFSDTDVAAVLSAHRCLDEALREQGLGHLHYVHEDSESAIGDELLGGYHQAGTTRMSSRPEDGVVDGRLAVHGFDDLFVASSSTFVTSSQANSTFMIVAFALRLADHLHSELSEPSVRTADR